MLKNSERKVYERFPLGVGATRADVANPDLLAFIKESKMKIVVIGGTGLIGSKVVSKLTQLGHDAECAG